VKATVHTPHREKRAASYSRGVACWNIDCNVGKIFALNGLTTIGSKTISIFCLNPKHIHIGQNRVMVLKNTTYYF
jgi:hypothetical protein